MSFQFLDDLDKNSGKAKYQRFSIALGIEKFSVLIPFSKSTVFEQQVQNDLPKSQKQLIEIVNQHNGIME